ncbi:MAG: hypothetical protein ACRDRH_05105 [Pseudonocardia sp.]
MGRTFRTTLFALVVAAAVSGCGEPGPDAEALEAAEARATEVTTFCDAARANIAAAQPLIDLSKAGGAPLPAEKIEAVVGPLRESNKTMFDAAPPELRADAESAAQLAEMQLAVFESTGGDVMASATDPAYVAKATELQPVVARFQGFIRTTCGVDVD